MKGRLKELRESKRLTQSVMGDEVGASQQNISKYEKDMCSMPVDMVIRIARYFNVTTDYLLGVSETKRGDSELARFERDMEEFEDLIELYKNLDERDQEIVMAMMNEMRRSRTRE